MNHKSVSGGGYNLSVSKDYIKMYEIWLTREHPIRTIEQQRKRQVHSVYILCQFHAHNKSQPKAK